VTSVVEVPLTDAQSARLTPYVPRLVVEWLRDTPAASVREVDGSLAFVDISGFTQLTERLARKGKVGAEEVNDTLDACFAELLSVAYDYGAGVVKWGGDAVLLLFDGPEHPVRACRAAVEMQRVMRGMRRLETSAGLVTLRMSLGIHSGSLHFFLVGDPHRELLIAGPAASETVSMEAVASPGEIVISPSTAALLDPRLIGRPKGGGLLLKGVPEVVSERAAPVGDVAGLDLARCLPLGIREHLLAGPVEPEHRAVGAAFVAFGGTDALLEREGPAAAGAALDALVRSIQDAAQRHDVTFFETDIGYDGGKAMLIAGAPTSAGNDPERLLRTARAIVDSAGVLPLRVGVNAGRVFSGDFGPPYRRTYSVKGDAVNLAARLAAKAEPGQILATDAVLDRARAAFETDALEPFRVKGKAQPVQAYAVGRAGAAKSRPAETVPLIGREAELAALLAAAESARGWEGKLVDLVGEPGMGKSRLLEELRARAGDLLVLGAACEEYEASTPYFAFRTLLVPLLGLGGAAPGARADRLREQVQDVAPHLLPWLPLIAIPLEVEVPQTPETESLDERFRKERLEEVLRDLLGIVLATPTLLVFEDVHWLDDASGDLLRALTAGLDNRPWVIVVTRRAEAGGLVAPDDGNAVTIRLEPLDGDAAAALAEARTEELPLPPHVIAALAERSGGNPLFLMELAAAAREAGDLDGLPDSVEELLAVQIDRLAPRDRTILRAAAVLGVSFSPELLAGTLTGEAEAVDEGLWQRLQDLVVPGAVGVRRFRHALIRDAAYEGLPYRRRRDLHARAGETIVRTAEQPDDAAELLSLHFFHAQRFQEAWHYSRLAGDRAHAIYANVDAASFYQRALEAARRLPTIEPAAVAKTLESLGDVRLRLSEFERAAAAFRSARQRFRSQPLDEARLSLQEALVCWRVGRHQAALRWIRRGIRILERCRGQEAAAQRASFYVWYAICRANHGHPGEATEWCRRAIRTAKRSGAREPLAQAYVLMDFIADSLGRSDAPDHSSLALAIYEELGNVERQSVVLNNMGARAYFRGAWEEARGLYERSRQAGERAGNRWYASFATENLGEMLLDQGRLSEAEPLFREVLRLARASTSGARTADICRRLGSLAARSGRFEEAHSLLAEARREYEQAGSAAEVLATDARIAECLALQDDGAGALALATEALERSKRLDGVFLTVVVLHRVRGWALMQAGRLADARQALEESLREARAKKAQLEIAVALDALVVLGGLTGEPAAELDEERKAIFSRLGIVETIAFPLSVPSRTYQEYVGS
jgi:class 3 adenylate cyclase/tetratricopeptide (TPR) repeat protein